MSITSRTAKRLTLRSYTRPPACCGSSRMHHMIYCVSSLKKTTRRWGTPRRPYFMKVSGGSSCYCAAFLLLLQAWNGAMRSNTISTSLTSSLNSVALIRSYISPSMPYGYSGAIWCAVAMYYSWVRGFKLCFAIGLCISVCKISSDAAKT